MATFHEGLTLVQRDRGAAWFADPDGARLLVCSEIGSEGRNFQFAHHLVLFDLPDDPALVEQRLGRLDRIGQREDIHVYVPVIEGTHLEVLARWYHDGLNGFEQHVPGARELHERFGPQLRDLASRIHHDHGAVGAELDRFITSVRLAREEVAQRLEDGRDRLLEWNSFKPVLAGRVIADIREQDEDRTLDDFMLAVFDTFFIEVEELAPRTWRLGSAGVLVDDFPGLRGDSLGVTRDRARALLREDLQFLTWDHPLATGALDMLLGSERGNCAFARWIDAGPPTLYLEAVYVLESLAPRSVHVDRFLPPTPVAVVVDHRGREAPDTLARFVADRDARPADAVQLLARTDIREHALPRMLERSKQIADTRIVAIVDGARTAMRRRLGHEIGRLRDLQKANRSVRDEEIAALVDEERQLDAHLQEARLRLDALRLIYRGPQRT
jgi:ATP-dependent helicase HepA